MKDEAAAVAAPSGGAKAILEPKEQGLREKEKGRGTAEKDNDKERMMKSLLGCGPRKHETYFDKTPTK
jgi:hypothetical protein